MAIRVGLYTRNSDGRVRIRRLVEADLFPPVLFRHVVDPLTGGVSDVPEYTFQGEVTGTPDFSENGAYLGPHRAQWHKVRLKDKGFGLKVLELDPTIPDPPNPRKEKLARLDAANSLAEIKAILKELL